MRPINNFLDSKASIWGIVVVAAGAALVYFSLVGIGCPEKFSKFMASHLGTSKEKIQLIHLLACGLLWLGFYSGAYLTSRFQWQLAARLACGFALAFASLDKLGDAAAFSKAMENYHVLPLSLVPLASVVIPWLEFLAGSALVLGFKWRGAALVFCALMAVYTFSISLNLLRGIDMDCTCFSMECAEKIDAWTVVRDFILLALGLFTFFFSKAGTILEFPFHRPK